MDELLQEFIAETRETLAAIASEIVAWEADPADRARLDAIFRFVHTVKGSCGFLDLPRLAKLSHEAESALAAVRDGRRQPDVRLVDAVLAIIDRIGELTLALETGVEIAEAGDAPLIAALEEKAGDALPADDTPAAAAVAATPRVAMRSVRLPVDLLDRVMSGMSDMVLARNELARRLRDIEADPATNASLERLSLTVADLRETVSRTRMQAIDALFAALPRMVRDTASQLDKQVDLTIEGSEVEIDREMIEAMRDPLMHIVRNAIDHGIERSDARVAAGKPAAGRLTVRARQSGNTIVIEVADDGAGIDTARLVAKHAARHGRDPAEYAGVGERGRAELVFEPGLSSRDDVTEISGRGVGMDVVRANVEQIGGRIELRNDPGRGLAIIVHVPLTLSILPTVVVSAAGQSFAIARQSIEEIVAADCASVQVHALGDSAIATVRGERMPLVELARTLGAAAAGAGGLLAIIGVPGGRYALAVDQVVDMQELVVKPAAPPIMACGCYAGQTLPDTGVPMLVLDAAGIASANGIGFERSTMPRDEAAEQAPAPGVEVLLYYDLDGARRAIPLSAVERIDEIDAAQVAIIGGRLRLCDAGEIVDVVARGTVPEDGQIMVVRLRRAGGEVAMAIARAIEIATLHGTWADGDAAGGILGVALHDGAAIEVVDPGGSDASDGGIAEEAADTRPVCVLAGEARRWMADFLAPALERAGYRVTVEPPADDSAVAVLAMAGEDVDLPGGGALIPLADAPDGAGVYRYDRAAVLAAIRRAAR